MASSRPLVWTARIALSILCAAVGTLTLVLALGDPYSALLLDNLQLGNLFVPLRTYLLRLSVANTGGLAVAVGGGALLLGSLLARLGGWMARPAAAALLLTPWLLPDAMAGLLWRPLLAPLDWMVDAPSARMAVGLVWLWRLTPLAALILAHSRGRARSLLALAAVVGCLLVDAGTVLLLTGGEPFNAAHTWASWTLIQLWVSRAWGYAAVMAAGLGAVTVLVAGVGLWAARRVVWTSARPEAAPYALWVAALLWTLPPWLLWIGARRADLLGGLEAFVRAGGLGWLLAWLVTMGLAAWMAAGVAAAAEKRARSVAAPVAFGLLSLLPVTLAFLRVDRAWLGGPWLVALLIGAVAGLAAWSYTGAVQARRRAAVLGVFLLMPHTWALSLVLDGPRRFYLLDQGVALVFGDPMVFGGAAAWGLLLSGALAWGAGRVVVALAVKGVDSPGRPEAARS